MSILTERRGHVAIITLNRPEARNAINAELSAGVGEALTEYLHDDGVRAVVITGAGDRSFCAGMDLRSFAGGGGSTVIRPDSPNITMVIRGFYPKPLVAAVNGAAVAGGFDLMLSCDIAVAAEHATFGLPETKRGLVSVGGGTRVARVAPLPIALEMVLTGAPLTAGRACELGLVNRVVPAAEVLDTAVAIAEAIAANGPMAVAYAKRLLWEETGLNEPGRWDRLTELVAPVFRSDDAKEGAAAFVEKRSPKWTGR